LEALSDFSRKFDSNLFLDVERHLHLYKMPRYEALTYAHLELFGSPLKSHMDLKNDGCRKYARCASFSKTYPDGTCDSFIAYTRDSAGSLIDTLCKKKKIPEFCHP